jgi:hypothetical protein
VINPCHLHDPNGMLQPDDITKTLSKHGVHFATVIPEISFIRLINFKRIWLLSVCVIHVLLLVSRLPQLAKTILEQGVARGLSKHNKGTLP